MNTTTTPFVDDRYSLGISRYGRERRQTQFYEPEETALADDYGQNDYDVGMFDENDPTFNNVAIYKRYHYDNYEGDYDVDINTDDESVSSDEGGVVRKMTSMSIDEEEDDEDYDNSFVTEDGEDSEWTDATYEPSSDDDKEEEDASSLVSTASSTASLSSMTTPSFTNTSSMSTTGQNSTTPRSSSSSSSLASRR
jgi:hypothetical protein